MKDYIEFQYKDIKARFYSKRSEMHIINENNTRILFRAWFLNRRAIRYLYPHILEVLRDEEYLEELINLNKNHPNECDITRIVSICNQKIKEECLDIELRYYYYY